ncbi:hypothetical protein PENDEC_c020G04374 [Penicillium decumbens]|uniref:Uncharacterized protein n=1 Tax=Penicillium decumbens TaxID=69771 RepID=A0A1V6P6G9_PENDC|nr:hypothetical protein PENDEC_c020G04374 [Penicillium decumbens]
MMVMVIYLQRLTLHKLPPKAVIVSVFLPLGPLGQGGYGAMKLGQCARDIFPNTQTLEQSSGATFYTLGFQVALILWSFGLILSVFVVVFWVIVSVGTLKGAVSGKLFHAPCLGDLRVMEEDKDTGKSARFKQSIQPIA